MKTTILMGALLLSVSLLRAQTATKQATVHIKKIETINGVEKITDTTYTTNDPGSIKLDDGTIDILEKMGDGKDGSMMKTIIINDEDGANVSVNMKDLNKEIEAEIQKALKEAGIDEKTGGTQNIVIINDEDAKTPDSKKETHISRSVIIKRIDITGANADEMKRINKNAGESDGKLKIENMNFYPNPSSGKFNLSFNLPEKGDADIMILNTDGKIVYKEKLASFTGSYDKEIDISKHAKGIYFVKVEQGKHAQVKKIILE